jgi:hypothetical protein
MQHQLEDYRRRQRENWSHDVPPVIPTARSRPNVQTTQQSTSDEELARLLQEQYNHEFEEERQQDNSDREMAQRQQQQRDTHLDQRMNLQSRRLENMMLGRPNSFDIDNAMEDDHADMDYFFEREGLPRPYSLPVLNRIQPHRDLFAPGFENDHHHFPFGFMQPSFSPFMQPPRFHYGNVDDGDDLGSYEDLLALQERIGHVPRGASQSEIENNSLKYKIDRESQIPTENKDCAICMDEFKIGDQVRRLPCMHPYHTDCIDTWLKTNRTCPVCKTEVKANEASN